MSIASRVKTAFDFIRLNDYENALIYISIVVDATSKKNSPSGTSQSERNKNFIDTNQNFIYRFSTGGAVSIGENGNYIYPSGSLGKTLYKLVRCGLLHDGILPSYFVMLDGSGIGNIIMADLDAEKPIGFGVSKELLVALLLVVVTSPINKREWIPGGLLLSAYGNDININNIWGCREFLDEYRF